MALQQLAGNRAVARLIARAAPRVVRRSITLPGGQATTVQAVSDYLAQKKPNDTTPAKPGYAQAVQNLIASDKPHVVTEGAWGGGGSLMRLVGAINAEIDRLAAEALAAENAKMEAAFKKDTHKVITLELLKLYCGSGDWRLRAVEEFDDESQDGTRNFGVAFEIKKRSTDEVMYTHFHVHHNAEYTSLSAHFKTGRSKQAPQSWDLERTTELVDIVKHLHSNVGQSFGELTSLT